MDIISKLKAKTYQLIDTITYKKQGHPPRISIGQDNDKRCLLIYLSSPLTWKQNDPRFDWHENFRQSKQIATTLASSGYQTDIIDVQDNLFVPKEKYDLFIGHGPNAIRMLKYLKPECEKICLTTGQYGPYANQQVQKRYNDLSSRQNKHFKPVYPSNLKKEDYELFDEIVCFGNEINIETFKALDMPIYSFPNYANPNISFIESSKKSSKHFIYIAASRHILKGLDLLLEVFASHPSWHLHICGKLDNEIKDNFQEYLARRNIHQHGYVKMGSRTFTQICKKSIFYISPTCSDSMQGTTLNAMAAGLIPVITKDTGVKLFGCGYYIEDVSIPELTNQIEQFTMVDNITKKKLSKLSREVVNKHYRPENFLDAWTKIIEDTMS